MADKAIIEITLLNTKSTIQRIDQYQVNAIMVQDGYKVVADENNTTQIKVLYPSQYSGTKIVYMKNARNEHIEFELTTQDENGYYIFNLPASMTYAGTTSLVFINIFLDTGIEEKTVWLPVLIPIYATSVDYTKVALASSDVIADAIARLEYLMSISGDLAELLKNLQQVLVDGQKVIRLTDPPNIALADNVGVVDISIDPTAGNFVFKNMKGEIGNGVKDTIIEYQAGTSGTTTPTGTWSATIPTVPQGQWLWTKTTLQFDDATKTPDEIIYSNAYQGIDGTNPFNCLYSHRYLVYVEGTIPSTTSTIYTNLWITFNSTRTTLCTTVTELTDFLYEMFDNNNITTFSNDIYNLNIMQGGMRANKNTLNLLNVLYAGTAMWANFLHAANSGAIDWWQCAVSETYGVSTIQYSDIKPLVWR